MTTSKSLVLFGIVGNMFLNKNLGILDGACRLSVRVLKESKYAAW